MFDPNENPFGDPPDQFNRPPRRAASPMALAAVFCAVLGILTVFTGFLSLFFGSLAVLLAFLSKGDRPKAERPALYAFRAGIAAIVISAVLIAASFTIVFRQYGSFENFYNSYLYTIEQYYGEDTEDSALPDQTTQDDMTAL